MKKIKINFKKLEKFNILFVLVSLLLSVIWLYISYKSLFIAIPEYKEFIENNKIPNLNWNWEFVFITENSNLKKYIWMKDKYDVFLIWNKNNYKWKWEKYESYWNLINPKDRARIDFEIVIKNNKLYWFFNLHWSREVSWTIKAELNKKGNILEWIFVTSAANSRWKFIWVLKN